MWIPQQNLRHVCVPIIPRPKLPHWKVGGAAFGVTLDKCENVLHLRENGPIATKHKTHISIWCYASKMAIDFDPGMSLTFNFLGQVLNLLYLRNRLIAMKRKKYIPIGYLSLLNPASSVYVTKVDLDKGTYATRIPSKWNGNEPVNQKRITAQMRDPQPTQIAWWRHQMETFSALLAICAGTSAHKGQWSGALMFSLICSWINGWLNDRGAGDLRCLYDVTVMCVSLRKYVFWLTTVKVHADGAYNTNTRSNHFCCLRVHNH